MPHNTPEKRKAYLERVKEQTRENNRRFRKLNPDYQKRYNTANPERFLKRLCLYAQNRNKEFNLCLDNLMGIYTVQKGRCALSGRAMTHSSDPQNFDTNISIDRIDSKKGYTADNVQLVCKRINSMKSDLTERQFIDWCLSIVEMHHHAPSAGITEA